MKTPEEWENYLAENTSLMVKGSVAITEIVVAIQRDAREAVIKERDDLLASLIRVQAALEASEKAREGMVPYEDVRALVDAFANPSSHGDEFIGAIQTKHPELFTK